MKIRLSQQQNVSLVKSAGIAIFALAVIGFIVVKVLLPQNSVASNTSAEKNIWVGTESSYWSEAGNWSLGRIPLASDQVILHAKNAKRNTLIIPEGRAYEVSNLDMSGCVLTVDGALKATGYIQLLSKKSELHISGNLNCGKDLASLSNSQVKISGGHVEVNENFLIEDAVVLLEDGDLQVKGDVELRRKGSLLRIEAGNATVEGDFVAHQSQDEVNRLRVSGGTIKVKGATVFQKTVEQDHIPASILVDGGEVELNDVSRGWKTRGYQEGVYNFKVTEGHITFQKDLVLDTLKEGEQSVVHLMNESSVWNTKTQYKRLESNDRVKVRYKGLVYALSQAYWASLGERPDTSTKWTELGQADDEDKSFNLNYVDDWRSSKVYQRGHIDEEVFVQHQGIIYRMSKTCNLTKSNAPSENEWAWVLWFEPEGDLENFSDAFTVEGGTVSFEGKFVHWSGLETFGDNTFSFQGDGITYRLKNEDRYQNLEIASGARLLVSGTTEVAGNITNESRYIPKGRGTLALVGNDVQRIKNIQPLILQHLDVQKDTGEVRLKGELFINQSLRWTASAPMVTERSGINIANTKGTVLSLGADAQVIGNGWFEGPVQKIGLAAFSFPTGKNGKKAPISVSASSDTCIYRAEYFAYDVPGYKSRSAELNCVSQMEYWSLEQLVKGNAPKVTLHWGNGNWSQINEVSDLVVAEFDGQRWNSIGQHSYTGSALSGAITSQSSLASATYYTYGSTSAINPLSQDAIPIRVERKGSRLEFYTSQLPDGVAVLEVQLSSDSSFSNFQSTQGESYNGYYSVDLKDYSKSFVRLLCQNVRGEEEYSVVSSISAAQNAQVEVLGLYPNPVVSETRLSLQSSTEQTGQVSIFDTKGTMVKRESLEVSSGQNEVLLSGLGAFSKGQYQLLIELNGYREAITFIKT